MSEYETFIVKNDRRNMRTTHFHQNIVLCKLTDRPCHVCGANCRKCSDAKAAFPATKRVGRSTKDVKSDIAQKARDGKSPSEIVADLVKAGLSEKRAEELVLSA